MSAQKTRKPSDREAASVAARVRASHKHLTVNEKKVAGVLLENYPVAGLEALAQLAKRAGVSPQSALRFVVKLGFKGFPQFQEHLRTELTQELQSPLDRWRREGKDGSVAAADFLSRFGERLRGNLETTFRQLARPEFEAVVQLLSEHRRPVHVIGGRLSHALAEYLVAHLRAIRGNVHAIAGQTSSWPDHLLNIRRGHLVVAFDIRRYQRDVIRFVELAAKKKRAKVVVLTDSWNSPASRVASHVLAAQVQGEAPWDSATAMLGVVEALIARVTRRLGEHFSARMAELESLREQLPLNTVINRAGIKSN